MNVPRYSDDKKEYVVKVRLNEIQHNYLKTKDNISEYVRNLIENDMTKSTNDKI